MQIASTDTVLGDFSDVTVPYFDTEARFSQSNGPFVVAITDDAGRTEEFEVTHTFGVTPLQQYLVDAPGGRKQALQFAWDSRSPDDGGQRWYHLYADEEIGTDDPLHWTGRYFNWNYMCAECHSIDVQLGYDIDTDSFATTFSEISVGCEACHGPGSKHVKQAEADAFDGNWGLVVDLNDRRDAAWIMNPETGIARRSHPNELRKQPEACGRCHARRSVVAVDYEYGRPLADTHMIALLDEHLYHADGRILDEVYVYGSFVQSTMYAAGVTCSDCHEPHSGQLRAGPDPNDTCATCHLTTRFASPDHAGPSSSDCVSCHMQVRTYMGVDDRRDHSFRLPNTATDPEHYGAIIAAGRQGGANDALLTGIANPAYPPIARATMLTLLEPINDAADAALLHRQLDDPNPLVRVGTLRALRFQSPEIRISHGSHLLRDPVRSVRVEAALAYAELRDLLPLEDARAFAEAADELRESLTASAAMPDAALNLAEFETRMGNESGASHMYEHALRIGAGLAFVQHAYGLYLVREGDSSAALGHLREATRLAPDAPQYVYVYGVALNSLGHSDEAVEVLADAWQQFPGNFDVGWALATIARDRGDIDQARALAGQLVERFPESPQARQLLSILSE
jgi:tetratricopeptide (TPR) repeat protein